MKKLIYILSVLFLLASSGQDAFALFKKKKAKDKKEEKKEQLTPYQKLFKGKKVETAKGLMTIHKVGDKIYVEFPLNMLEKDMVLTSSIENTSDGGEGVAGQFGGRAVRLQFSKQDTVLQARMSLLSKPTNSSENPNIDRALDYSNRPGIFKSFSILAYTPDSSAVVVDMKKLFFESSTYTDPFPSYAGNSLYGFVTRDHKLKSDKSFLRGVKAFDNNVVVQCEFCYAVDHKVFGAFEMYDDVPLTATINKILMLLPEKVMRPRLADSRIGVDPILKTDFVSDKGGVKAMRFAKRWNVEPANEEQYKKGELTEPKKAIVFYLDSLVPQVWKRYIKAGAEDWNTAFEKIGFKNVVQVKDFPVNDSTFDANDINCSTIRYSPLWMNIAQTSMHVDARTGEIFNASIYLHSNLITNNYYKRAVSTMAVDPRVRTSVFPEDVLGEMIQAEITKAVGICLGLVENRGASYAYPLDSLRSATFTQKYGLCPSIMDDIVYNYVAQPGDMEKGVRLAPKGVGEYDCYAIKWLYKPIYDASTSKDEFKVLDQWIREQSENPNCRFARRQSSFDVDPSSLSGDLSNDHIGAMRYMMKNLKYSLQHCFEWYGENDRTLYMRGRVREDLTDMFYSQISRMLDYVGGMYIKDVREGYDELSYEAVPAEKQEETVKYVLELVKDVSWLDDNSLVHTFEIQDPVAEKCRFNIFNTLFSRLDYVEVCEQKTGSSYTADKFMNDIYTTVWEGTLKNRKLDNFEMDLQAAFLSSIINVSSAVSPVGSFKPVKANGIQFTSEDTEEVISRSRYYLDQLKKGNPVDLKKDEVLGSMAEKYAYSPVPPIRIDQSGVPAQYYDILLKTKGLLTEAVGKSTGTTKLHYDLLLFKISKALDNK